ncbi:MAG: ComEC/Rec2 family competence protein [bacterium]|nr:ComEC/Rec2 family competence protein [bacterium]
MKEQILFAVISGFLAGVFARSFFPLGLAAVGFAALLAFASLIFAYIDESKRKSLIVIAVALLACAGGILRMNSAVLVGDPELTSRLNKEIIVEGVVSEEPDVRESNIRISLHADTLVVARPVREKPLRDVGAEATPKSEAFSNGASTTIPISAGILVVAPRDTSVKYGDRVRASGLLRIPESFETGEGRKFNYPEYLAKDGIGYELAFADVELLSSGGGNMVKKSAIWIKQKFLEGLGNSLGEPQAGLGGGLTVGAKRGLGKDLTGIFITVGLIHVVVLSGYNIMLVINGALKVFSRAPRLFKLFLTAFIAVSFALMTGGASSSVRAAVMAVIGVVGRATGRLYFASRVLSIVAFGMVLWNPFLLSFDIGFQLSVLATFGLIWFTPVFSARLQWITGKFALREIAASTLGTQLAVLPLLLYQNGQLPLFSLPANLLALIAIPPAMAASTIASLAGLIAEPVAPVIAFPAYLLLTYIIDVAKFFSSLPFASLGITAFSAWWMFGAYAVMFGCLVFIKKRAGRVEFPAV